MKNMYLDLNTGSRLTAHRNDGATNYDRQKAKTTGSRLTPCRDDGGNPHGDRPLQITCFQS